MSKNKLLWLLVLAFALYSIYKGGNAIPGLPSQQITAAVYVWDKETIGTVPPHVLNALDRINVEKKVEATNFEIDDSVPTSLVSSVAAAKTAGLPSFVTRSGDTVVKTIHNPKTEAEVFDAVPTLTP